MSCRDHNDLSSTFKIITRSHQNKISTVASLTFASASVQLCVRSPSVFPSALFPSLQLSFPLPSNLLPLYFVLPLLCRWRAVSLQSPSMLDQSSRYEKRPSILDPRFVWQKETVNKKWLFNAAACLARGHNLEPQTPP